MKNRLKLFTGVSLALLLLAGCSSVGNILGTNNGTTTNQLRGTVDSIDLNSRSIYLTNVSSGSMLSSGGTGNSVRVYYDNDTTVQYQGRNYRPEDLERGDQVDVRVQQSGSNKTLVADSINVVSNVRTGGSTLPGTGTYGSTLHGTVRSVDTYGRTISVDTGSGPYATVQYGTNTPVYFNGRSYMVSDLEVGDEIDIRVQNPGSTQPMAQDITVTRSVSGSGGTSSSAVSTLRGTVQYVDTANRTIQLSQTSWIAGFDRGAGTGTGSILTIRYDSNVSVNVQGQMYPVSGLERGDVIDVRVQNLGGSNYLAQSIMLVRDVSGRL